MRRRSVIAVLVLAAILVVAGFFVFLHAPEPSYQGKTVTRWIDDYIALDSALTNQYRFDLKKHEDIRFAFKEMGTNCIPFIFRRLERQDAPMGIRYRAMWPKLPGLVRHILPAPKPALDANTAIVMLANAGPASFPFLMRKLQSPSPAARQVATEHINSTYYRLTPEQANLLIPRMTALLNDPNKFVRLFSAGVLGEIGPKASNAVPSLIVALHDDDVGPQTGSKVFVRAWAAIALGKMGPAAATAVPTLQGLLSDSDRNTRAQAAVALWRIDGDVETTLPIIIQQLADRSPGSKAAFIISLGEMGPRAQTAIPALTNLMNQATDLERDLITNALYKIDPAAAAKLGGK